MPFSKVTISSRDINCGGFVWFGLFVCFCENMCLIFNMHSLKQNLVDIEADQYLTEDFLPHST